MKLFIGVFSFGEICLLLFTIHILFYLKVVLLTEIFNTFALKILILRAVLIISTLQDGHTGFQNGFSSFTNRYLMLKFVNQLKDGNLSFFSFCYLQSIKKLMVKMSFGNIAIFFSCSCIFQRAYFAINLCIQFNVAKKIFLHVIQVFLGIYKKG